MSSALPRAITDNVSRRTALAGIGTVVAAGTASPTLRGRLWPVSNATTSPSGVSMPTGDLAGWQQVIAEDFAVDYDRGSFVTDGQGDLIPSCAAHQTYGDRLRAYPEGWNTQSGNGMFSPDRTVSTSGSVLDIYLHTDSDLNRPVSGAVFPLRPGGGDNARTYGRWSWRMRASDVSAAGWGCVSLLWPQDSKDWPGSGEADWPEGDVSGSINGWNHPRSPVPVQIFVPGNGAQWSDWHTYTIEWSENSIAYFVDDHQTFQTSVAVPAGPMRWLVQSGPSGQWVAPSTTAHVQIDWVVSYDPA